MIVTDIRLKLVDEVRLKAYCTITLDFVLVIHDLKIIDGNKGLFVSFPSRKATVRCTCGCNNVLRARYCNACGIELQDSVIERSHFEIVHPIDKGFREYVDGYIIEAYLQTAR